MFLRPVDFRTSKQYINSVASVLLALTFLYQNILPISAAEGLS